MINVLRNTWKILTRKERRQFTRMVACDLIITIADILFLAGLLWVVRFYIQPTSAGFLAFLPSWIADRHSLALITLFLLLFTTKNIFAWLIAKSWQNFSSEVAIRLSKNNLTAYQHASYSDFVQSDSSKYVSRIAFHPFEFCQYVLAGLPQLFTQFALVSLATIAILIFKARLFLLLLLILFPPVILMFYLVRRKLARIREVLHQSNEVSFQYLLDALKGFVESNIYGKSPFFSERFIQSRRPFSWALFASGNIQTLAPRMIEVFAVLGLFLLVALASWNGSFQSDYLLILGAFAGAAYKIIPGVVKIINLGAQVRAHRHLVDELMTTAPSNRDTGSATIAEPIENISLENISFSYEGRPILQNFSLTLAKGDFAVITGASGKGKTTIINLLLGLLEPHEGRMLFNHRPVQRDDIRQHWPRLACIRQQPFLFHDTVIQNITFGESTPNEARLHWALEASGIWDLISKWPKGLHHRITENGKNISGGQAQRIAIARALYRDADVFVFDEPAGELDEEAEKSLMIRLDHLTRNGKIVVLITHNKDIISFGNKWISLDERTRNHTRHHYSGIPGQ